MTDVDDGIVKWTHDQLTGWMGEWFVARMWDPAAIEVPVGFVVDGNPYLKRRDDGTFVIPTDVYKHARDRAWVADVAGVCTVTPSRIRAMGMCMDNLPRCLHYSHATWICEVKVTRSDFRSDDKWDKPRQAHLQFIACPRGVVTPTEVPQGWGLLEVYGGKDTARVRKHPLKLAFNDISQERMAELYASLLHVLWIRGRHLDAREEMRQYRQREASARNVLRVGGVVDAVLDYLKYDNNKTLEDCLRFYGIRSKAPSYVDKRLQTFKDSLSHRSVETDGGGELKTNGEEGRP